MLVSPQVGAGWAGRWHEAVFAALASRHRKGCKSAAPRSSPASPRPYEAVRGLLQTEAPGAWRGAGSTPSASHTSGLALLGGCPEVGTPGVCTRDPGLPLATGGAFRVGGL